MPPAVKTLRTPAFVLAALVCGVLALARFARFGQPAAGAPAADVPEEAARLLAAAPVRAAVPPAAAAPVPDDPATSPLCVVWDDLDASGAAFSKGRANDAARLLSAVGLPAPVFPLSKFGEALAEPRRVAHLVFLGTLPEPRRKELRAFLDRGGRVVVHHSSAPGVAAAFGVKTPSVETVRPKTGAWESFAFEGPPPLHAPERVPARAAAGVFFVEPVSGGGVKAVARWRDAAGAPGPPAILRGPAGFWLSRPLYGDTPAETRSLLLLSLSATLDPPLWKRAAVSLLDGLWRASGATSLEGAEKRLLAEAPASARPAVRERFVRLRALEADRAEKAGKGLYGASIGPLWKMRRELLLADAAAHPLPRAGKRLAVWARSPWAPGGRTWEAVASALAAAGVTDVFLFAGSPSACVPALPGFPAHPERASRGDPFPEAVAACKARGIRVHAWIFALQTDLSKDPRADSARSRRLLHKPAGGNLPWLDPAHRANADELSAFVRAVAAGTGVDGASLDYFRYPEEATREKRDPAALRALLSRVRRDLRAAAPSCALSLCCYAYNRTIAQDWDAWLADGLLDFALPMNYAPDTATLRRYADLHPKARARQLCGIGAGANESLLDARELLSQIRLAWKLGYAGAAVYPFDERFLSELAEPLSLAR